MSRMLTPLLATLTLLASLAAQEPILALKGLDPVELCRGHETAGKVEIAATYGIHRYRFANAENHRLFESDPERWGIQWGGACGRMGPLSGTGSPDRFWVWKERIWIFASDSCREGFKKKPESFEWTDDAAPAAGAEESRLGRERLDAMIAAMGGAEAVAALGSYRSRFAEEVESGGETWQHVETVTFVPGRGLRRESRWNDKWWAEVRAGAGGFRSSNEGPKVELAPSQVREFDRQLAHDLLQIIGRSRRSDLVVRAREVEGEGAERLPGLDVHFDAQTTTIALDPETHRPRFLRFRGRPAMGQVGEVEVRLGDWRKVGALTLPHASQVFFAGKPTTPKPLTLDRIEIGIEVDEGIFRD